MEADAASLVWFVGVGFVVPGALVVLAFLSPTRHQLGGWAETAGVTLTPANVSLVRRRLGRARRFRAVAAFPFWWLTLAPTLYSDFPEALANPYIAVTAYVLGGLVADLTWQPDLQRTVRQAAMLRRSADDYEPAWIRVLPWMLISLSFFALSIRSATSDVALFPGQLGVALAAAVALTVASEVATRSIAGRAQPGDDIDLLAADDALRATSIAVARSGAAVGGLLLLDAVFAPERYDWPLLVWLPVQVIQLGMLAALLGVVVRQETWGHRRRFRQANLSPAPTP